MALVIGTNANDELDGTSDSDVIQGLAGNDTIYGNGGADTITGDDGDDIVVLSSGNGADSVDGGAGNDLVQLGASTTGWIDGGLDSDTLEANGYDISGLMITNVEVFQSQSGDLAMQAGQVGLFQSIIYPQEPAMPLTVTLTDSGTADFSMNSAQGIHLHLFSGGDTVTTGDGDDAIIGYGGTGPSTIVAGGGSDFIVVSCGNDFIDGGAGDDTVGAFSQPGDSVNGGSGNDFIEVTGGLFSPIAGVIDGGGDSDTLYAYGGTDIAGLTISNIEVLQNIDDTGPVLMSAEQAGLFQTIVDFSDPSRSVAVNLTNGGVADFSFNTPAGVDLTLSDDGDNVRTGASDDTVLGGAGNDTIETGGGADHIDGGRGLNMLSYAHATGAVQVSLNDGAGTAGDATSDTIVNIQDLVGTTFGDRLTGDDNINALDGGTGADTLTGLGGDDRYRVDNAGDKVVEADGGGTDTVSVLVSYTLSAGQSVEILTAEDVNGIDALTLTGNSLAQRIDGNAGNNMIDGRGGGDALYGHLGNDTYRVASDGDLVYEAANEGSDTIFAALSYSLLAGQSVECLATSSRAATVAIDLTGNELAQRIDGNYGDNVLSGGGGGDTLYGFLGNDTFHIADLNDKVVESIGQGSDTVLTSVSYTLQTSQSVEFLAAADVAGTDTLTLVGNNYAQRIDGNAGNNVIDGHGGGDTLYGHLGNDTYRITGSADIVCETAGEGSDTVFSAAGYTLLAGQSVEDLATSSRAGTASINLTGNELAQRIDGNYGNNVLSGGGGGDSLYGFLGDDKFFVSSTTDKVYEAAGQGSDTVFASVSYTLATGQSVEYLATTARTGADAISLTGNEQAQRIDGNYGINGLYGGDGNDTLYGFDGNDRLGGGNGRDLMDGGNGNDIFTYSAVIQSTGVNRDLIQNMNFAQDKVDLPAVPTGIDTKIIVGALSEATFDTDLASAVGTTVLAAHHAVLFDPSAGTDNIAGRQFLIVDVNGVAGYQAGQDYVIELQSATGTLTLSDFV